MFFLFKFTHIVLNPYIFYCKIGLYTFKGIKFKIDLHKTQDRFYMKKFVLSISIIKWQTWVLLFLILFGIFLRTYKFHDWLQFGDDQIRDAYITSDVITGKSALPLTGPFMSYSGDGDHGEENSFHMGPIYYYFQIISAKIFGNYPDKLAYPDVFFSILSIPLFYLFFRIYFGKKISLGVTGLYAISAYFISYSRFAWNTNPIPFFVLLLLFSLYKFLEKNEKVHWIWVLSLGFALGVGFQLHAIVMIIFSAVTFLVFLVSMKRNFLACKKWTIVLLMFLALNTGQIVSEVETNFSNTKTLLNSVFPKNGVTTTVLPKTVTVFKLKNDIDCHIEANFFLLSSYGNGRCAHDFVVAPSDGWTNHYFKNPDGNIKFVILLASLMLSVSGYFFLIYYSWKEKDTAKKCFLRLIILYFAIGFLIMLPLSKSDINEIRYFVFGFFMPFLFLGFLLKFVSQKITKLRYIIPPVAIIFGLLIYSNVEAINAEIKPFMSDSVTCSSLYRTTLGELEPVVQYMISHSNGQKQIYLDKDSSHRVMPDAMAYLLNRQGIKLVRLEDENHKIGDSPRFYVSCKMPKSLPQNTILKLDDTYFDQKIGQIYIFQLNTINSSK